MPRDDCWWRFFPCECPSLDERNANMGHMRALCRCPLLRLWFIVPLPSPSPLVEEDSSDIGRGGLRPAL